MSEKLKNDPKYAHRFVTKFEHQRRMERFNREEEEEAQRVEKMRKNAKFSKGDRVRVKMGKKRVSGTVQRVACGDTYFGYGLFYEVHHDGDYESVRKWYNDNEVSCD